MRKWTLLLIAALLLQGCTAKSAETTAPAQETTAAGTAAEETKEETSAVAESGTAETENTEAESETESKAEGEILSNDIYSFQMPAELDGMYTVEKDELFNSISIYDKKAEAAELPSMVFGLYAFEDPEEYRQMPGGVKAGELTREDGTVYDIVIGYPTDVMWDQVKAASDTFTLLYDTAEAAAKSVKSTDGGSFEYGADTRDSSISHPYSLANPWHDVTADEAAENCSRLFKAPEGAENVSWSMMGEAADPAKGIYPLVQLTFDLDGLAFTARARQGAGEDEDISGMYYSWDAEDAVTLANWGEGRMQGKVFRSLGEDETADLCTWYDVEIGIAYSLTTVAPDLDGFDIQAVAESMYDPEKESF